MAISLEHHIVQLEIPVDDALTVQEEQADGYLSGIESERRVSAYLRHNLDGEELTSGLVFSEENLIL
uniref:Uncharacterized protein n=1 Tax=Pristionchus pacificus TaxID=54126 RepID=A0A2A6D3C2_PRIPA|eukprot:PDM84807.1 hypothetical protein PRIPAC_33830 [Pristionchus pacificus]